jgi:hypothetical protein
VEFDSEQGGDEAWNRLSDAKDTQEWWAFLCIVFSQIGLDALTDGDPTKAAWAAHNGTNAHAMFRIKDRAFEDTFWRGYLVKVVGP